MDTNSDTLKFLQAVFPEHARYGVFANLKPAFHTRDFTRLDGTRDCYWSIAAFRPEAATNQEAGALEVRAFVVDDVGDRKSVV